jgi:receptor protein-tyrosine kinase
MTAPKSRAHLVERAVEALGGAGGLELVTPPPPPPAAGRPPATPAPEAPARAPDMARAGVAAAPALPPVALETMARAGLVTAPAGSARNRTVEEFAVVQHQVLRVIQATQPTDGRGSNVVLVTSARPGEGKSYTALNLAAGIAAGGARPVVLVDADGKPGSLSEALGLADAPGLRALAADPARRPATLLAPTALPRLSVLPYGAGPGSGAGAAGMPSGASVAAAVLRLAGALPDHLIVLDTPPCLATSEPSTLASVAGQVLMVVEAERTQRNEVEAALDMVEACPVLQLLLNRVRLTANDTFGAYGAYGAQPGA